MKRKISIFIMTLSGVIMIVFVINSCKKSNLEATPTSSLDQASISSSGQKPITSAIAKDLNTSNEKTKDSPKVHYNLEVILRSVDGNGGGQDKGDGEGSSFGHIKFRQDPDVAKIVTLDVWVRGLLPNHNYLLQRAVDTNLDGNCTSTSWLTLGKGLTPQSILTDDKGTGREDLWRDVSAVPSGSTFDIHFQVVDQDNLAVVLTSDCYQYTVR
jgi:hypothetical protein